MCYSWYVQFKYCNTYSDNFHLNLQSLFYQQKKSDKTDFLYPPKKARHNIITKPFKSTLNCWVQGLYYELHQVPVQNEVQMFELFMTVPVYLIANISQTMSVSCFSKTDTQIPLYLHVWCSQKQDLPWRQKHECGSVQHKPCIISE